MHYCCSVLWTLVSSGAERACTPAAPDLSVIPRVRCRKGRERSGWVEAQQNRGYGRSRHRPAIGGVICVELHGSGHVCRLGERVFKEKRLVRDARCEAVGVTMVPEASRILSRTSTFCLSVFTSAMPVKYPVV